MTDRVNALVVVLDQDIREDDVESLVNAIRHFRHVASVEKKVASISDMVAYARVYQEFTNKILNALKD